MKNTSLASPVIDQQMNVGDWWAQMGGTNGKRINDVEDGLGRGVVCFLRFRHYLRLHVNIFIIVIVNNSCDRGPGTKCGCMVDQPFSRYSMQCTAAPPANTINNTGRVSHQRAHGRDKLYRKSSGNLMKIFEAFWGVLLVISTQNIHNSQKHLLVSNCERGRKTWSPKVFLSTPSGKMKTG